MQTIKFSLCIATMNRFDKFLLKYLPKYLENQFIEEIIITDENGEDIDKITKIFPNNTKLKLHKNENCLGPFLNKLKCCKLAKNEWIVLIDSDNFADIDYFDNVSQYLSLHKLLNTTVLMPSFAKPQFNYEHFSNNVITKNNLKDFITITGFTCCMNTGNYVINKYLINNIDISKELNNIQYSSSSDVIYFNTLLFEQFPTLELHIIKNLHYLHVVHDNSIYLLNHVRFKNFENYVDRRFKNLI
jgi:hypothetical protein